MNSELIEKLSLEIKMVSLDPVEAEKAVSMLKKSISVFEQESNKEQLVEYVQKQLEKHRGGDAEYAEHFLLAADAFLKYTSYGKNI